MSSSNDTSLYKIGFEGNIAEGFTIGIVKKNLAQLFKTDADRVNALFTGQLSSLKKNIDLNTAKKYQAALLKAGAIVQIYGANNKVVELEVTAVSQWSLSPVGSTLLTAKERANIQIDTVTVDTDHISLTPNLTSSSNAIEESNTETINLELPNIDKISIADVGATLKDAQDSPTEVQTVTELHADLAPLGTPLIAQPNSKLPDTPPIDISALSVAPADNKDLYPEKKEMVAPIPPDTSHLSMEEIVLSSTD